MTPEERKTFNVQWVKKLHSGGWICASWPTEYGGKGLSLMDQVVLNEEFAKGEGAVEGRLLRRHPRRPHDPPVGHRGAEEDLHSPDPRRDDRLVPGILRARRRKRPRLAQDPSRASTGTNG